MEPRTKPQRPNAWRDFLVGLSFIVVVLGVSLPLILADQVSLTWPTTGYIACQAGETTVMGVYLYDYGNWLWLRASHAPLTVKLEDPDLKVVKVDVSPVTQGVFRQTKFVKLTVLVARPGQHTIRSITIATARKSQVIELGPIILDSTDASDPHLIAALTGTVTSTDVSGAREQELNFFVQSISDMAVQVEVSAEKSPPFLTITPWPPVNLGPHETGFAGFNFKLAKPYPEGTNWMYLWRPWLIVRVGGSRYLVPGPLIQLQRPG